MVFHRRRFDAFIVGSFDFHPMGSSSNPSQERKKQELELQEPRFSGETHKLEYKGVSTLSCRCAQASEKEKSESQPCDGFKHTWMHLHHQAVTAIHHFCCLLRYKILHFSRGRIRVLIIKEDVFFFTVSTKHAKKQTSTNGGQYSKGSS